jgi:hypothetical protein
MLFKLGFAWPEKGALGSSPVGREERHGRDGHHGQRQGTADSQVSYFSIRKIEIKRCLVSEF